MEEKNTGGNSGYWIIESDVSNGFNRLKAKIFNLIEATITDEKQAQALKGLVKGFSNDEYKIVIDNMRFDARNSGYIPEGVESSIPPLAAEPLEVESH